MKVLRWIAVGIGLLLSIAASAQTNVYKLNAIRLTNGWTVTGTITTDGATGTLTSANLLDWNFKVVQTTDMVWTEKDSNNLNISGVLTDGAKVFVTTSPDGVLDGGALYFGRGGGGGRIPTNAVIADFTQLGINLGYVGGIAGWQDELAGLNFVGLNQRNHTRYRAALAVSGQPNVFRVTVPPISASPLLMTLFGTFTTDGTLGALLPNNILAWNITARTQDITYYTKANSTVLSAIGVTSDGTVMRVSHAGGQLKMGIGGMRPTFVTVADFTDPTYPDGFANYYMGNYGVMGDKSPLTGPKAKAVAVAVARRSLTSFFISQIAPSIATGATLPMFGYAEYSDGSQLWVTSTTHWTSSNPSVASVQDQGQASPGLVTAGLAPGTTTITASFGGLQQSTKVTVAANAVPIDLMDMSSTQNYLNFQGGLYENSSGTVPTDHDAAGKAAAARVQPLDQNGNPSASGAVVFLGIGMSNATQEFNAFAGSAARNSSVNHTTLAMEDGALAATTACYWTVAQGQTIGSCPNAKGVLLDNQYDRVRDTVLAVDTAAPSAPAGCGGPPNVTPCLTEKQVQVLWIKNANPRPGTANSRSLCDQTIPGCVNDSGTEAILYESQLGQTIRAARSRYPNLKQVFLATRIYAGYATNGLNPEPYAYEYGYSAKWLIEAQVLQERNGTVDPIAGDMSYSSGTAAWTDWGTYLWADGTIARSDGTTWLSSDFQSDGTHPDAQGTTKVVNLLMNFFLGSPYTPWFRP